MPIVSKHLHHYREQRDGRFRTREVHVDALGTEITRQYLTTKTQVEVEADMTARDLSPTLVDRDVQEVIQWVENGNDTSTFDLTGRDITENDAEDEVTQEFARREGDTAIRLAWWIEDLGVPQWNAITTRLGWSNSAGEIGDRVQSRGQALTVAIPFYDETESV